jgi:hypothetical protein
MRQLSLRKLVSMSAINYALQSGQPLILMPLAIAYLTPAESALWLYWGIVTSFAFLCDLGLKPTLARAYVFAREKRPNSLSAAALTSLSRTIYSGLFIITLLASCGFNFITSQNLISATGHASDAIIATFLMCLALAFNVASMGHKAKLIGLGRQDTDKISDMLFNLLRTLGVVGAILFTQSLLWIGLAYVFSAVILFLFCRTAAAKLEFISQAQQPEACIKAPLKELAVVTGKASVLQIASFIVYNAVAIYIAQNPDPQLVSNTLVSLRCFLIIQSLALMPLGTLLPQITRYWLKNQTEQVYKIMLPVTAMSLTMFIGLSLILYFPGDALIQKIKTGAHLVTHPAFALLFFTYLLEIHHIIHATIYMQKNHVPFVPTAIIASVAILVLGFFCQGNLIALLSTQLLVQLCTNNWYPVFVSLNNLHKSMLEYLWGLADQFIGLKFLSILKLKLH